LGFDGGLLVGRRVSHKLSQSVEELDGHRKSVPRDFGLEELKYKISFGFF
jgi:hypothetical protein